MRNTRYYECIKVKGTKMKEKIVWSASTVPKIYQALADGHVLVGTSDTVFGLLALPTQKGFDALNAIKGRSEKPYLIVTGSVDAALKLCDSSYQNDMKSCMQACWPGPVTLIMPAAPSVPDYMKSKDNTIAVRVPQHEGLLALLQLTPYAFSTSANLAGQPVAHTADDVAPEIAMQSPFIIVDEKDRAASPPSTIIDCTVRPCKIIRQGAMTLEALKQKCGDLF